MEFIKKLFRNYWLLSVFCVVLGIALVVRPEFFSDTIGYVIGGLFTGYGIVMLIMYFAGGSDSALEHGTKLIGGLILCAVGVYVLIRPEVIAIAVAVFCGFYMLISGIVNTQSSLSLKKYGSTKWKSACITAVITMGVGIVMILNPLMPVKFAAIILGVALAVSGLVNLYDCAVIGHRMKKMTTALVKAEGNGRNVRKRDKDEFIDI